MFKQGNDDFNNIFESIFKEMSKGIKEQDQQLLADVIENENGFRVVADVPGVNKSDIKITFEEDILKIETPERSIKNLVEGEKIIVNLRKNVKTVGYFKFKKQLDKESVKAVYNDGVLTIDIKKKEKESVKSIIVE